MCITTNQPYTKFDPYHTPNPNPTTKQHAIPSHVLNSYVFRESYTIEWCCTFCTSGVARLERARVQGFTTQGSSAPSLPFPPLPTAMGPRALHALLLRYRFVLLSIVIVTLHLFIYYKIVHGVQKYIVMQYLKNLCNR